MLFEPLNMRGVTIPNRVWVSPMCQYSAADGLPGDWHLVQLGKFAVGGAGLVMTEATAVSPVGRSTPDDTGIWTDAQAGAWGRIVGFIKRQGALSGVQIGHAGRKASTGPTWDARYIPPEEGGWGSVGPSAISFGSLPAPTVLDTDGIAQIIADFRSAACRANEAGFDIIEVHAAHGYLLHEFLSPLANHRIDEYGGELENRARLLLEVVDAVRCAWPDEKPVFVRMSVTDWVEGGWSIDDTVLVSKMLLDRGVDLIDCSSGGILRDAKIPDGPGYQVEFARKVRREAGIATGAVGMITNARQADEILTSGSADAVFLARELLRSPNWPLHAALDLSVDLVWPNQFARAKPRA